MRILKKITITTLLAIVILYSCQSEPSSIKKINLIDIEKEHGVNAIPTKLYPIKNLSKTFYMRNFIYFLNNHDKIIYKFSKRGDNLLKITHNNLSSFPDLDFLFQKKEKDKLSTAIDTKFPLPNILDLKVDKEENIYLKVSPIDGEEIPEEDHIDYNIYMNNENHPIYLHDEENSREFKDFTYDKKQSEDVVEVVTGVERVFFIKLNKFGQFESMLLNSKENPYFRDVWDLHLLEGGGYYLSRKIFKDSIDKIETGYRFLYYNSKNELVSDNSIYPSMFEVKELGDISLTVIENMDISSDGTIYVQNYLYKGKSYPTNDVLYEIKNFNNNEKDIVYNRIYNRVLLENLDDNRTKLLNAYQFLGNSENLFDFFLEYSSSDFSFYLIIYDRDTKKWRRKKIDSQDIKYAQNFHLAENGFLLSFAEKDKQYNLYYWSTDLLIRRLMDNKEN